MGAVFTFRPVRINTATPDEEGLLVFRDDKLIAVAVHLAHVDDASLRERWNLEAVFDRLLTPRRTFAGKDDMERWFVEHGERCD